jgi:hypothetical protein
MMDPYWQQLKMLEPLKGTLLVGNFMSTVQLPKAFPSRVLAFLVAASKDPSYFSRIVKKGAPY